MHSTSGAEGIELPAALALLLGADLIGARERPLEHGLKISLAADVAANVTDDPAKPGAQQAQLPAVTVELLGMGIAPRHHRRALGDAQTISTRDGVQLMITVIRCPRTGGGCSDAICRDRSWCRKLLERGLSRRGLPLKRKFRPRCCARVALLDCEHSAITKG